MYSGALEMEHKSARADTPRAAASFNRLPKRTLLPEYHIRGVKELAIGMRVSAWDDYETENEYVEWDDRGTYCRALRLRARKYPRKESGCGTTGGTGSGGGGGGGGGG
jgi:hypothetical protein